MINTDFHDNILQPKPIHNVASLTKQPSRNTILILKKDYQNLVGNPIDGVAVRPDDSNICIWYFLVNGPCGTPYARGLYIGVIIFPIEFPYKPPEIQMISPTGRFKSRESICLTLSSFHNESWNASWSAEKIIIALVSFMVSNEPTTGCYNADMFTELDKIAIANASKNWLYRKCSIFKAMFQNEYNICHKIHSSNLLSKQKSYLMDIVLNESLQLTTRILNMNKRLDDYIENFLQIELVLLDLPCTKRNEILQKYFKLSTTNHEIQQLELFHSEDNPYDESPYDDVMFYEDDEVSDEVEFYSSEDG